MLAKGTKSVADKLYPAMGNNDFWWMFRFDLFLDGFFVPSPTVMMEVGYLSFFSKMLL